MNVRPSAGSILRAVQSIRSNATGKAVRLLTGPLAALSMVAPVSPSCGSRSGPIVDDPPVVGGPVGGGTSTPTNPPTPTNPSTPLPGCTGTPYTEELPSRASLGGLAFSSANAQRFMIDALATRFPQGQFIMQSGLASSFAASQGGSCFDKFIQDRSSPTTVLRQASTVVHECGHYLDLGKSAGSANAYVIRDDLDFVCTQGDTTTRNGGKTFARSLLRKDAYYAKRKACGSQSGRGCDMYADIYLDGSPTDATFQSGDQGYNFLLEEATQYVNSLATALAFRDSYVNVHVSERDGILTFLWYVTRYLKMARVDYPSAYSWLSANACWREATLSVWDRGWFYLDATKNIPELGLDADAIEALVKDPSLVAEIDALRAIQCR